MVAAASLPLFSSLVPPTLPIASQPGLDLRVLVPGGAVHGAHRPGVRPVPGASRGAPHGFRRAARRQPRGRRPKAARPRGAGDRRSHDVGDPADHIRACLIRAVWRVQAIDPGFASQNVLTLRTALPRPKYDSPVRRGEFYERVLAGVRALPGVQSAAFITGLPMVMTGIITGVEIPGQDARSARSAGVSHRWVTPQYFRTMGIPLRRGRDVEDGDTARPGLGRRRQRVVRRAVLARSGSHRQDVPAPRSNPDRRGSGRRRQGPRVGADQRAADVPARTAGRRGFASQLRPEGSGDSAFGSGRSARLRHPPDRPCGRSRAADLGRAHDGRGARGRHGHAGTRQLQVLGVLAAVAVLLSGVGIYGLLAYTVSQRSQEIGVRLALGAEPSRVGRMIFADGMRLAALRHRAGRAGCLRGRARHERVALWRRTERSRDVRHRRRRGAPDDVRRFAGAGAQGRAGDSDVRAESGVGRSALISELVPFIRCHGDTGISPSFGGISAFARPEIPLSRGVPLKARVGCSTFWLPFTLALPGG